MHTMTEVLETTEEDVGHYRDTLPESVKTTWNSSLGKETEKNPKKGSEAVVSAAGSGNWEAMFDVSGLRAADNPPTICYTSNEPGKHVP